MSVDDHFEEFCCERVEGNFFFFFLFAWQMHFFLFLFFNFILFLNFT